MKHFRYDPSLAVEPRSSRATASSILIEIAALFGLLVLASLIAVSPLAIRFLGVG